MTATQQQSNRTTTGTQKTSSGSSVSAASNFANSRKKQYTDKIKQKREQLKSINQRNSQEIERLKGDIETLKKQYQTQSSQADTSSNKDFANKLLGAVGGAKDPSEILAARAISSGLNVAGRATGAIGGALRNIISKRLAKSKLNNSLEYNTDLTEKCTYKKLKTRLQKIAENVPANNVGSGSIEGINPPALSGIGKNSTAKSLARRHKVKLKAIQSQLKMGSKVEKEHTKIASVAKKIATDHVYEDPRYYSKLKKMENRDIGNDTTFTSKDRYKKYRTPIVYSRKAALNKKPGEERI